MRVGLLAEELYYSDLIYYVGGATPQCWDALKKELEGLKIEHIAVELRPEDGPTEWLILASAPFKTADIPLVAKRMSLGRSARQLSGKEACGWVLSMMKTAKAEHYRVVVSGIWGLLVVHDKAEVKSA